MTERIETGIDGLVALEPKVFGDERGFFTESYRRNEFSELGIHEEMVQDNHSRSSYGIVRGMHFQIGRGAAKLVRCGRGAIVDVLVDARPDSPAFGQWEAFELSDENHHVLYVPHGFGHGFCVLSEVADVLYKQTHYYDPQTESEISFRDPDIAIAWPEGLELKPSQRDLDAPRLRDVKDRLPFRVAV